MLLVYLIIILAVTARLVPHLANFAPISALALFGAVYLPKKQSLPLVLGARFISDIFLGFFSWPLMLAVYLAHAAAWGLGLLIKPAVVGGKNYRWLLIVGSALASAGLFFAVTNFAFLYANYPQTLAGIAQSYLNGLPFLRGTVLGDVVYSAAMFGAYEAVTYLIKARQSKQAAA